MKLCECVSRITTKRRKSTYKEAETMFFMIANSLSKAIREGE